MRGITLALLVTLIGCWWPQSAALAQVSLNELCAKNDVVIADADGDFVDYIELFNAGATAYDLSGHYLSSDPENAQEWQFPAVSIPAGEHLMVFASGKNRTTPDLHTNFQLSRDGEQLTLSNSTGTTIDQLTVGILRANHSYGRVPDGGPNAYYFTSPTPADSNTTNAFNGYAPNPVASSLQGFYKQPFSVFFSSSAPNLTLRYTTDGSAPTETSPIQNTSLSVDTTEILRVRAFGDSIIPSEVVSNTYFIADTTRLPVVSLSTDPGYFFDIDTGIYVMGTNADTVWPYWGANWWNDVEVPVHVEFYNEDRVLGFEQDLGLKVQGWVQSRNKPMKSLQLIARSEYGSSAINYRMFANKRIRQFKRLTLRNSGGDFSHTHLRDGFLHTLMIEDKLHLDLLAYRPSAVYLNGQFLGIHNIREKTGDDYIKENYRNVNQDSLDILENDSVVDVGSFDLFNQHYDELMAADLTTDAGYAVANSYWDINNVADYFIAETFWNNYDWPYWNVLFWRERKLGSLWRYVLVDLDVSLNAEGWANDRNDNLARILRPELDNNRHLDILRKLLENPTFKRYFINRYADLMNTSFSTAHTNERLDALVETVEPDIARHFERWGTNSIAYWHGYHLDHLTRTYLERKPDSTFAQVNRAFELDGPVELTFKVWPPEAATVHINSIEVDEFPWQGRYFNGNSIDVTVEPRPGYAFKYWESLNHFTTPQTNTGFTYNFTQGDTLVAFFETHATDLTVDLYPNPANDVVNITFALDTIDEVEVTLFDAQGRLARKWGTQRLAGGLQELQFGTARLPEGLYFIRVRTAELATAKKLVILGNN